jgi:hypothetical protein
MVYDWQFIALMIVAVLITGVSKSGFAGGGYLTYGVFSDDLLKVLLGVFSILFGPRGLLKPFRGRPVMSDKVGALCGGIAGFTSFIAHAGGRRSTSTCYRSSTLKESSWGPRWFSWPRSTW